MLEGTYDQLLAAEGLGVWLGRILTEVLLGSQVADNDTNSASHA